MGALEWQSPLSGASSAVPPAAAGDEADGQADYDCDSEGLSRLHPYPCLGGEYTPGELHRPGAARGRPSSAPGRQAGVGGPGRRSNVERVLPEPGPDEG